MAAIKSGDEIVFCCCQLSALFLDILESPYGNARRHYDLADVIQAFHLAFCGYPQCLDPGTVDQVPLVASALDTLSHFAERYAGGFGLSREPRKSSFIAC